MHVEPLEKLPRSVRDFLSHYAMIVLSILTALALEQVALGIEHRHEGHRAKGEIEQEVASNRKVVEESLAVTQENAKVWEGLLARAVVEMKSEKPDPDKLMATLKEAGHNFRDALPPLKSTAWDASLSDHSVNYLEHADLTRYSELYAAQRLYAQAMWDMLSQSAARDLSSLSLALTIGKADALTTVSLLNGRLRTIRIVESQLQQLDAVLKPSGETQEPSTHAASDVAPAASAASR